MGSTTHTRADDIIRNYASAAGGGLLGVVTETLADLEIDDPSQTARLMSALSAAFIEGIRVGEAEVLAQAIEQGVDVTVLRVGLAPDPADDLT